MGGHSKCWPLVYHTYHTTSRGDSGRVSGHLDLLVLFLYLLLTTYYIYIHCQIMSLASDSLRSVFFCIYVHGAHARREP